MSRLTRGPPRPILGVATFVDVLRTRAERQPDQIALRFLLDGEDDEVVWSYAELDRRAREVGARLQELGADGDRALLLYPPGLDYVAAFMGCLYAGCVAVPAYPPTSERALPHLQALAADAGARLALTTPVVHHALDAAAGRPALDSIHWLLTDSEAGEAACDWRDPGLRSEDLAFLQYTSGSTGDPKGVMVSHANLLDNSDRIAEIISAGTAEIGEEPDTSGMLWLPPYHDMGLIGGILHPIYGGFPVQLMSPLAFLQKPVRWLRAISRFRANASAAPSFAYALCVRKVTPEQRESLDLGCWKVAINGGEPARAAVLEAFASTFAPCGFRREAFLPCYGLAETTLIASAAEPGAPWRVRELDAGALEEGRVARASGSAPSRRLVGCGRTFPGQEIRIVDPQTGAPRPPCRIGEIWISGPSVAQGYWNRPEETAATFRALLPDAPGVFYLRTGDLGFVDGNELFVSGRLKDLIIIRGRNHYPQDIEATAEASHAALRPGCGAAFSVDVDGEERLVLAYEVARGALADLDGEAVARAVRRAVSQHHELQVHVVALVEPGGVPKTSSGKIRHRACRSEFLAGTLPCVATSERSEAKPAAAQPAPAATLSALSPAEQRRFLESFLREQVAAALRVEADAIDPRESLGVLGMDSLAAVELSTAVEEELGLSLPVDEDLRELGLEGIVGQLRARLAGGAAPGGAATPEADAEPEDLFDKCQGDGGYFGSFRAERDDYFTRPILEGPAGPRMRFRGRDVIVWSVNNYLGVAGRPEIRAAAAKALEEFGTWSPMGSRMMTGNTPRHIELERRLASFCRKPASVLFNYGYLGVLGTMASLVGSRDVVVIDKQSHACIVDGALLASARRPFRMFEHNDPGSLESQLRAANRGRRGGVLVATEGVFGMTGELAPLPEICALSRRYDARLFVDDAHGFGVMGETGRGTGEHFGTQDEIDLYFGTFAKAFAAIGGVTAGEEEVVEYIRYNARPNVFAKSLPLVYVEVLLAALELIEHLPELRAEMWRIARRLQRGLAELGFELGATQTPITPVYVPAGDPKTAMEMIRMLREEHGIFVSGITYPVVPPGILLFRMMPTASHTDEDIDVTLEAFEKLKVRFPEVSHGATSHATRHA